MDISIVLLSSRGYRAGGNTGARSKENTGRIYFRCYGKGGHSFFAGTSCQPPSRRLIERIYSPLASRVVPTMSHFS
ncbi:MAG TPA: hypothetical protein PLK38_08785, partial [Methanoregulaceae archaeon]|nr:hypothetical protein [Methanoregulaceae archaeon]